MIQGRGQSGDGFNPIVQHEAPVRQYSGIVGLQTQLFVGRQSGGRGSTCTISTTFERGPREEVNKTSSVTGGDVTTKCKAERLKEALHIVDLLGIRADCNTYVSVLQECINSKDLAKGKQVHSLIIQNRFKPNIFLLNTLVNMYAKCGSLVDARQVFEKMLERNSFTWNIMIAGYAKHGCGREAFEIFRQMQLQGVIPNKVTFICILNACASLGALEKGKEVHADIVKGGIAPDINLETALADMYAKCGSLKDARQVFDNMAHRNVVSWNTMITGYTQHGCGREALKLYEQMQQDGVTPSIVTFICVLNACASLGALEKGQKVHADIRQAGIAPHIILENTVVDMYGKCGSTKDARQVFDNMAQRDVVSWNSMIAGYAQHGCGSEAFKLYEKMQQEGMMPDRVTYICILNACGSVRAVDKGKRVHSDIINAGIVSNINLETALADMYAKCGSMKDAQQVFGKMAEQDVVSWNAMITGYAHHGYSQEAFETYEQMQREGVIPNMVTFVCILNACANVGALVRGKQVHADIIKAGIVPDIILGNTLVDMYAKCGSIRDAQQVFDNMAKRDVVSWNAMITGYAQDGSSWQALNIYEQMREEEVMPDKVTFICVLNVYATLGALEKGQEVHADIINSRIIPDIVLENTLVDMYAKCGSVKDALQVFDNMAKRNVVSWNAIIAGYGQHGCGREAILLFEQMQLEGLNPDGCTFISLLSACSHVGLVNEGHHYFDIMSHDYALTPAMEHFGCMVDLLGRAGQLSEAEDFINKMPIKPDASVWGALLGACRIHGNVELAEHVANFRLK